MGKMTKANRSAARVVQMSPVPLYTQIKDELRRLILDHVRQEGQSAHDPVGTCRMGSDAGAVVDARLRVHGIAGLRVADASIMPTLVSGNTNAACMMIGEKAAEMLAKDHGIRLSSFVGA